MKKAFIFRLPDELLDDIISRAAYLPENTPSMRSFGYEHSELYGTLTALCLSCRRLNRLAKPHLYADPVIYCYMPRRSKKTTELIHRSCRENQFLWPLCKRLIIHYKDGDNADDREHRRNPCLYVAMDSVTWFTAVKSLVIFGVGTDERGWILLRSALENIKGLNLLSLGNQEQYNLRIPQVVEIFSIFKLEGIRTLHLEGISMCRGDTQSWRPLQVSSYHALSEQKPSSIIKIRIVKHKAFPIRRLNPGIGKCRHCPIYCTGTPKFSPDAKCSKRPRQVASPPREIHSRTHVWIMLQCAWLIYGLELGHIAAHLSHS